MKVDYKRTQKSNAMFIFFTGIGIALQREFGWGPKRIQRVFDHATIYYMENLENYRHDDILEEKCKKDWKALGLTTEWF